MRPIAIILACLIALPAPAFTPQPGGPVATRLIPLSAPVAVPEAAFVDEAGAEHRLPDWKGKVVLAVIWATWCEVCRRELPILDRLAKGWRAEGIEIVPVSVDQINAMPKIRRFMDAHGLKALPRFSESNLKLAAQVGLRFTPTTLIVDPFGNVISGIIGEGPWEAPEFLDYLRAVRDAESSEQALRLLPPRG